MKNELKNAKTLNEVIEIANKYYDLDKPLGVASKGIVVTGIEKVIKMTNTPKR